MGIFSKKSDDTRTQNLNSSEYEACLKRISELSSEFSILKAKHEAIESSLANFRGIINRKLGMIKEEEEKKSETIINDGYVAFG
jgi:predicted  nucleic acid-binding Zn-ribbon protein